MSVYVRCLSTVNQGDNTLGIVHRNTWNTVHSICVFVSNQEMFGVMQPFHSGRSCLIYERALPLIYIHINRLVNFSWVVREVPCTCDLHNKSSVIQCKPGLWPVLLRIYDQFMSCFNLFWVLLGIDHTQRITQNLSPSSPNHIKPSESWWKGLSLLKCMALYCVAFRLYGWVVHAYPNCYIFWTIWPL